MALAYSEMWNVGIIGQLVYDRREKKKLSENNVFASVNIAFHIGYHKTGTTYLQQIYFNQHPNIHLISNSSQPWLDSVLKRIIHTPKGHFNKSECRSLISSKVEQLSNYNPGDLIIFSAERLSGHPYSGGYDSYRIAERIYSCVPGAKILVVVRNQVTMLNSVYKQLVGEGYLGKVVDLFSEKPWKSTGFHLKFYEYDNLISKYQRLFRPQNVLVLPYELMVENLTEFLSSICEFFGIDYVAPTDSEERVNPSLPNRGITFIRFLNHFRRSELNPYPLVPLPELLMKAMKKIMVKNFSVLPDKRSIFSIEQREKIQSKFKKSNERMLSLVERNKTKEYIDSYFEPL